MTTSHAAHPTSSGRFDLIRSLVLVAALTAHNAASDVVAPGIDTTSLRSLATWVQVALFCGALVGLGCVVWGRTSLRELGWRFDNPGRLVVLGLLLSAALIGTVFGVYALMAGRDGVLGLWRAVVTMSSEERLFYFVMGARNAFIEETLFRGSLLTALRARLGGHSAVLISSAIHASFHRSLDPVPLLVKLVFAIAISAMVVRTRSLVPGAIAHTLLWAIVGNN